MLFPLLAGLVLAPSSAPVTSGEIRLGTHGVFFVEVEIERKKLKMLFDTGFDRTVLNPVSYQLVTGDSLRVNAGGNATETRVHHDVRVGGVTIGSGKLAGGDYNIFKRSIDGLGKCDGILGRDLIGQRLWIVDYLNRTIKALPAPGTEEEIKTHVKGLGDPIVTRAYHSDKYLLPVENDTWREFPLVDTGAGSNSLPRKAIEQTRHSRIGSREIMGFNGNTTRALVLATGIQIGGQPTVYPDFELLSEAGEIGILSPVYSNFRAIALFPDRRFAFWPSRNVDMIRSKALKRIAGAHFTVQEDKVFVSTYLPEDDNQDREVVSIQGMPVAKILDLLTKNDALAFTEVDALIAATKTNCELEIKRPDRVAAVKLNVLPRR